MSSEATIFGDRIAPLPPVPEQEYWDLLRLAGTLDLKRQHIFLRVLAETANVKLACQSAGYRNMAPVNRALKDNPGFAVAFKEATDAAGEFIEAEAIRRAVQGVKKAVYYKGEIIDYEVLYSDTLLVHLLKAAKPDKYADRSKHTVDANLRIGIAMLPPSTKNEKSWEQQSRAVHEAQKALGGPAPIDAEFKEIEPNTLRRS